MDLVSALPSARIPVLEYLIQLGVGQGRLDRLTVANLSSKGRFTEPQSRNHSDKGERLR